MSGDMTARLAAIKDIPTERLIQLARAEAAGLVVIRPSAADAYIRAFLVERPQKGAQRMNEYTIKHLVDKKYIRQVMQAILDFEHEHGKGINAKVADAVGLPPEGLFAFSDTGELLGGLTFQVYNDWVFVEQGFVWPKYRRQGIYAALFDHLEYLAVQAALVGLDVWTYAWEAPAVYEALGFVRNGQLRNFPRGNTSIHYIKEF